MKVLERRDHLNGSLQKHKRGCYIGDEINDRLVDITTTSDFGADMLLRQRALKTR